MPLIASNNGPRRHWRDNAAGSSCRGARSHRTELRSEQADSGALFAVARPVQGGEYRGRMLTYQIRRRRFVHGEGASFEFPGTAVMKFHFAPAQPFGEEAGGGHTFVKAVPAKALFNANTGEHTVESSPPLAPLDVTIQEPSRLVELRGTLLRIEEEVESLHALQQTLESVYFAMPWLLAVQFADPPYIARVEGTVGATLFRWELADWRGSFGGTTQDRQEGRVATAWNWLGVLAVPTNRRLLAALHHLHVACRLIRASVTPGEFLAEALLNFSKVLEVLFPPSGDTGSIDAARLGLEVLGYSVDEVEARFVPAIALRNGLDVGHVQLGLLKIEQLETVHAYSEGAEAHFRELLARILVRLESGEFDVRPYELKAADGSIQTLIQRMASRQGESVPEGRPEGSDSSE